MAEGTTVASTSVRTSLLVVAAVLSALFLSGCVSRGPEQSPNDPGIPEARAEAASRIAELRSRLDFSDRVIVLGTGQKDDCGAANNWWFDDTDTDPGYRCWMSWTAVAVIPDAQSSHELAAAVDDEMAALELPYQPGGMVRTLMSLYPPHREVGSYGSISGGGHEGAVRFEVKAESFRPDFWPTPSIENSGSGDTAGIGVADIQATGANQIIEVSASVEYWNTTGLPNLDEVATPGAVNVVFWGYGDTSVIELADWAPAETPAVCTIDPAIDQATITRSDQPFPYLRLTLVPTAQSADQQRVRECLLANTTSGTLVSLYPQE